MGNTKIEHPWEDEKSHSAAGRAVTLLLQLGTVCHIQLRFISLGKLRSMPRSMSLKGNPQVPALKIHRS